MRSWTVVGLSMAKWCVDCLWFMHLKYPWGSPLSRVSNSGRSRNHWASMVPNRSDTDMHTCTLDEWISRSPKTQNQIALRLSQWPMHTQLQQQKEEIKLKINYTIWVWQTFHLPHLNLEKSQTLGWGQQEHWGGGLTNLYGHDCHQTYDKRHTFHRPSVTRDSQHNTKHSLSNQLIKLIYNTSTQAVFYDNITKQVIAPFGSHYPPFEIPGEQWKALWIWDFCKWNGPGTICSPGATWKTPCWL
jgi:hypothetical protein